MSWKTVGDLIKLIISLIIIFWPLIPAYLWAYNIISFETAVIVLLTVGIIELVITSSVSGVSDE